MADKTCPQGHVSTWDDFCSVCGNNMDSNDTSNDAGNDAPTEAAPSASSAGGNCPNCSNPFGAEDVFCESCGLDFATGTLPGADPEPATPAVPESVSAAAEAEETGTHEQAEAPEAEPVVNAETDGSGALVAVVACDREYFDKIVGSAGLDYPNPEPAPVTIALTGAKILIGRHNQSRGVYPEIDIDSSTNDPAASTRHAMLRQANGGWTITDLDSTNGTMVDDTTSALAPGEELPVSAGSVIYVGAFTRITLEPAQ